MPEWRWGGAAVERLEEIALSLADYAVQVEILDGVGREQEIVRALRERPAA